MLTRTMSSTLSVYDIFVVEQALELLSIDCGLCPEMDSSHNRIASKNRDRSRVSRLSARLPVTAEPQESSDLGDQCDSDPKEDWESALESSSEHVIEGASESSSEHVIVSEDY
eukprot:s9_g24.t1